MILKKVTKHYILYVLRRKINENRKKHKMFQQKPNCSKKRTHAPLILKKIIIFAALKKKFNH